MFCCHTMFRKNGFRHLLCAVILVLLCKMCASLPSVGVDEQGLKYYNIYIIESPCFVAKVFFAKRHYVCSPVDDQGLKYFPRFHRHCSRLQVPSTKYHVQPSTLYIQSLLSPRSDAGIALIQPVNTTTVYSDLRAQLHALATRCVIKYFLGAGIPHARPNCCVVILLLSGPSRGTVVALEGWN